MDILNLFCRETNIYIIYLLFSFTDFTDLLSFWLKLESLIYFLLSIHNIVSGKPISSSTVKPPLISFHLALFKLN